jgi:hypothetical protein
MIINYHQLSSSSSSTIIINYHHPHHHHHHHQLSSSTIGLEDVLKTKNNVEDDLQHLLHPAVAQVRKHSAG